MYMYMYFGRRREEVRRAEVRRGSKGGGAGFQIGVRRGVPEG